MDTRYNDPSDYVMVGGEYYRKCRTLYDMSSDKVALLPWPRSQINEDFRQCPQKGLLGYNTKEVEQYFASAVAKDRLRVASTIKVDDEPTRKQMWDVIQEYRPKVKEYDKLISSRAQG